MLQKVPAIRKLYEDPSNQSHRRVIDEGVRVQTPLIEPLLSTVNNGYPLFTLTAKFDLPVGPSLDFIPFARSVAEVWDSTTSEQRRGWKLPEPYLGPTSSSGFSIFSYVNKTKSSLKHPLDRASSVQERVMVFEHLRQFRECPAGIAKELAKDGIIVDSVVFTGKSVSYRKGSARFTVADISRELEDLQSQLRGLAETMARRLCFGFSPLL